MINYIACTDYTIGFDTAVNTAMEAIDKIRDTSTSHERCSIIEVMGRNAGYIALWCGIANGAEDILLPERYDNDEQALINHIIEGRKKGKKHHLIINAEGIGHSTGMARRIEAATGIETRATIFGYMQRGGSPTCKDRMYASIMGAYAVDLLAEGKSNRLLEDVSDNVFIRMSDTQTPQGIMAVVKMSEITIEDLFGRGMHINSNTIQPLLLILENLQDPGNLGTIIRMAEGAGVTGVIMSCNTVDIYNPKTIRSTMGSLYRVPVIYVDDICEAVEECKQKGIRVYAAHLKGTDNYNVKDYTQPTAFMIGNEGNGLTDKLTDKSRD